MHRLELCAVAGEPHSSRRDNLMARGATELLKPGSSLLVRNATFGLLHLGDETHRGEHRHATFIVLSDLHPLLGEAKPTSLPQRMTVLAAMLLEDIFCQVVAAHLRHLRFG